MTKKTSNWSALPVGACSLCVSRSDTAFKDTRKGLLVGLRFGFAFLGRAWKRIEAFHRTDRDRDVPWLARRMTLIPTYRRTGWDKFRAPSISLLIGLTR